MEPTNSTPASTPTSVPAPAPIAENNEPDNNQSWKIATAIAAIVAICGIGFGVYGVAQSSQKDNQISNLKNQIDSLSSKISSPEINDNNDESINNRAKDDSTVVADSNSENYIYVGEWGFKIKKPENWRDLVQKYTYYNDYPQAIDTFEIMENESVATSHAMISPGNNNCKDDEWLDCVEIKLGEESILNVFVPKSNSGHVSEDFRNWVTNSDNYSKI